MDGLEIAATSMCNTDQCLVCECPKDELDKSHGTDFLYPLLYGNFFFGGGGVKTQVEAAQAKTPESRWKHQEPLQRKGI
jgi:hypothetical protein